MHAALSTASHLAAAACLFVAATAFGRTIPVARDVDSDAVQAPLDVGSWLRNEYWFLTDAIYDEHAPDNGKEDSDVSEWSDYRLLDQGDAEHTILEISGASNDSDNTAGEDTAESLPSVGADTAAEDGDRAPRLISRQSEEESSDGSDDEFDDDNEYSDEDFFDDAEYGEDDGEDEEEYDEDEEEVVDGQLKQSQLMSAVAPSNKRLVNTEPIVNDASHATSSPAESTTKGTSNDMVIDENAFVDSTGTATEGIADDERFWSLGKALVNSTCITTRTDPSKFCAPGLICTGVTDAGAGVCTEAIYKAGERCAYFGKCLGGRCALSAEGTHFVCHLTEASTVPGQEPDPASEQMTTELNKLTEKA